MKNGIADEYYAEVARRLKAVLEKKNLSEGDIVRLCSKNGFDITQSSVSKLISFNKNSNCSITLINCVQVCKALEVPIEEILDHKRKGINLHETVKASVKPSAKRLPLIFNTEEDEFQGYLGLFHTYFFPTISGEDTLLHGIMNFEASPSGEYCAARFELDTNKLTADGVPIVKLYDGELIISVRMGAGYCILYNIQIGELCFITFNHMYLNNEDLYCRLATVVTTSAGNNRRPTMQRMLFSRRELTQDELSVIQSQLLLNSTDILISALAYQDLCQKNSLPEEMLDKEKFIHILPKEEYYSISESHVRGLHISREEKVKALCALRSMSTAKKYNKIGSKCDELIFEYLYGNK